MKAPRIGVIADYDPRSPYHPATTAAIEHAAAALGLEAVVEWIPTPRLTEPDADRLLAGFDALLAGPGSPYRSFDGALRGIRFARERGKPFAGT
jgi:CTP synthase (UTP-ammonia lyase)